MRFLLDESVDVRLAGFLRSLGHDCAIIGQAFPSSLNDLAVLAIAFREARVLITLDRHFGKLVFSDGQPHAGVVYLRLRDEPIEVYRDRLRVVLDQHAQELGQFVVVDAQHIRVRES
jgi:predicted nuclease of predicted toxin-antitoxin system